MTRVVRRATRAGRWSPNKLLRKAAKSAPMAASFTICIWSRSRHPRNRGGLGTTTKSCRSSPDSKPSGHSAKANAISCLHSCARGHDRHSGASPPRSERTDPARFPVRRRLSAVDRLPRDHRLGGWVSAVALYTFGKYGSGFSRIASSNLPALVAASDLAQRSQALAANAPNLAVVDGHFARRAVSESLRNQLMAIAEASMQVERAGAGNSRAGKSRSQRGSAEGEA